MAKKRLLRVDASDSEEERTPEEEPPREKTWEEWLRGTYSKYWYFVICLFIDVIVAIEIGKAVENPWSYFLPLIVVGLMVLLQWQLYLRIWGRNRRAEQDQSTE